MPEVRPPGGIIAFDLAGCVGWAYGHERDNAPAFGSFFLSRLGEAQRYCSAENEIEDLFRHFRPAHMIMESTLSIQAMARHSSQQIANQQITLRGIALIASWREGPCSASEIDVHSVRRETLGTSSLSTDQAKRLAVRTCRRWGWAVTDHNQADACLVWRWIVQRRRGQAPVHGPLWREVA